MALSQDDRRIEEIKAMRGRLIASLPHEVQFALDFLLSTIASLKQRVGRLRGALSQMDNSQCGTSISYCCYKRKLGQGHTETCTIGQALTDTEGKETPTPFLDIVFDGPPGHISGRFIEVEDPTGKSVCAGEWIDRGDFTWALRIPVRTQRGQNDPHKL